MPQSRSTAIPRHQKKERLGTNKDKTNATYKTTDAQATKKPPWNRQSENYFAFDQKVVFFCLFVCFLFFCGFFLQTFVMIKSKNFCIDYYAQKAIVYVVIGYTLSLQSKIAANYTKIS